MWIGLIAVVVLAGVLLAGTLAARARVARARSLPQVARRAGLEYREFDPFNSTAVAFRLFRAGDDRLVAHVMWRGDPRVRVFDYAYAMRVGDGERRVWHEFSCALAQHDGVWPEIAILPARPLDRALAAVADVSVDVESEEFNRTFVVRCADRKFATDLLAPEMMELLLSTRGELAFETRGRFLLVSGRRVDAAQLPGLLRVAESFLERIPPVVPELYGAYPDGLGTQDLPVRPARPARPARELPLVQGGFFGDLDDAALSGRREPYRFAPPPDLDPEDDPWDPTPGVDHDLDGRPLPPSQEDPWGEGRPHP
jgi:hypothetical protein